MVTKNRGTVLQWIALASWALLGLSCGGRSRLLALNVNALSLRENTVGLSNRQQVLVYLPPSYGQSGQRRYPVLYFLPGYDDPAWIFAGGALQGFRLRDAMDRLTSEGRIGEMIVVLPSGATPLGGTFYTNSSVLGRWEDYISGELVEYVDTLFRTQRSPAGRAIAGTTAGGSGALILAMHHPDIFGSVYALDPVLLRPGGSKRRVCAARRRLGAFSASRKHGAYFLSARHAWP
jgi:S-formylglutathione hydrolase